jgi:hypothetical protein
LCRARPKSNPQKETERGFRRRLPGMAGVDSLLRLTLSSD